METASREGPWIFEDGRGRRYLVQMVPMEHDGTVDAERQPRALVFQTDEGWIRVVPVGHEFALDELSRAQILNILKHLDAPPDATPAT